MSQCVICSDNFDNIERVSATPCGHVYHQKCVQEWLNIRTTCPECRTSVSSKNLVNLYFNPASINPDNALTNQVEKYKRSLSETTKDLAVERQKVKELSEITRCNENKLSELRQSNMEMSSELASAKRELKKAKQELQSVKSNFFQVNNELKLYEDVKQIVNGTQAEADEILKQFAGATDTKDSGAAKRLAYCCVLTKRELEKVLADKSKLASETVKLTQNLFHKTSQLNSANVKIKRLNQQIKDLLDTSAANSFSKEPHPKSGEPLPSTSVDSPCQNQQVKPVFNLTPIATDFEKPKMNVVIIDKSCKKVNVAKNNVASPLHFSLTAKRQKENDSISNTGYNGLGGHHNVIQSNQKYATSKVKRKLKKF